MVTCGSDQTTHCPAFRARCRTGQADLMQASCSKCDHSTYLPHSCGHRGCPPCQHPERPQRLERQLQKRVPAEYFLITFTLPAVFFKVVFVFFNQAAFKITSFSGFNVTPLIGSQLRVFPDQRSVLVTPLSGRPSSLLSEFHILFYSDPSYFRLSARSGIR